MAYNPQKHHRRSIRLKGYDYAQAGLYFLTLCCDQRISRFGHVFQSQMILNAYGIIAHNEWLKTPERRPHIELGAFIIMPNHMHGIIKINSRGELNSPKAEREKGECDSPQPDNSRGELNSPELEREKGECDSPLRSPSNTVGAIVRGYKSPVTKQLGLLGFDEQLWQRNYYEHIIRDEQAYQNITAYILNNPAKWDADMFYQR